MAFIMVRNVPSIPTLLSVFIVMGGVPYQILSPHILTLSCDFCLSFCLCDVLHLLFVNTVPSLHPWDESHLVMVYDLFNVLLDMVCQYFVENFSVYVHQGYWPEIFFLCYVCIWFWN